MCFYCLYSYYVLEKALNTLNTDRKSKNTFKTKNMSCLMMATSMAANEA